MTPGLRWPTGSPNVPIVWNLDPGKLGSLSHDDAHQLLLEAFAEWEAVGLLTFQEGPPLPADVNAAGDVHSAAHYMNYWSKDGDGLSPIIFDDDGSIIDDLVGQGAHEHYAGLAILDTRLGYCAGGTQQGQECLAPTDCPGGACTPSTTIQEASIILNGTFFDGVGDRKSVV